MYEIVFRNQLLPGKGIKDFIEWLQRAMPLQKSWGAEAVKISQPLYGETGVFYVTYRIRSLDMWNQGVGSEEGQRIINELNGLIDTHKTVSEVLVDVFLG